VLTLEAAALVVLVRGSLWFLSFATVRRLIERRWPAHGSHPRDLAVGQRIGSAVAGVGRRLPGTTCLVEALAADAMLRRRGVAPAVRFGARPRGRGATPDAHAWLECDGIVVVGGSVPIADYAEFLPPR
jgi:transglutaminase superfamily protein